MATLLAKAKKAPAYKFRPSRSELPDNQVDELCVAWLNGEVTYGQVCRATGMKGSNVYNMIARSIRRAIGDGRVHIAPPKK